MEGRLPFEADFEDLRTAYNQAFDHLRAEIQILNLAEDEANKALLGRLKSQVEEAEQVYHQRRNELAEFILTRRRTGLPVCSNACV